MEQGIAILKELIGSYSNGTAESDDTSIKIPSRDRPPIAQINPADARGDTVSSLVETMVNKKFPYWAASFLAYDFVDAYFEQLYAENFSSDKPLCSTTWHKEVLICFEKYMANLMDGSRDFSDVASLLEKCKTYQLSVCSKKNRKPRMEDSHAILPSLAYFRPKMAQKQNSYDAFFAVMDGHYGPECAVYASTHLADCLVEAIGESQDIEEALKGAIAKIDKKIEEKCRNENIKSGTTLSCAYLEDRKTIYLAWCGDSPIGILRETGVDTLTTPHKPEDMGEMKRIEAAGGMVVSIQGVFRLNGVLNLSRSLGDIQARPMISSTPDTLRVSITGEDYILFLASDGVWDLLDELDIFEFCRQFISDFPPKDFEYLAEFIANKARAAGASDNLTLICVFLKPVQDVWDKFAG